MTKLIERNDRSLAPASWFSPRPRTTSRRWRSTCCRRWPPTTSRWASSSGPASGSAPSADRVRVRHRRQRHPQSAPPRTSAPARSRTSSGSGRCPMTRSSGWCPTPSRRPRTTSPARAAQQRRERRLPGRCPVPAQGPGRADRRELKDEIEAAIKEVRESLTRDDAAAINSKTEALEAGVHKVAEAMYQHKTISIIRRRRARCAGARPTARALTSSTPRSSTRASKPWTPTQALRSSPGGEPEARFRLPSPRPGRASPGAPARRRRPSLRPAGAEDVQAGAEPLQAGPGRLQRTRSRRISRRSSSTRPLETARPRPGATRRRPAHSRAPAGLGDGRVAAADAPGARPPRARAVEPKPAPQARPAGTPGRMACGSSPWLTCPRRRPRRRRRPPRTRRRHRWSTRRRPSPSCADCSCARWYIASETLWKAASAAPRSWR